MEFSVNAVTYMAVVGNIGTSGVYMALENIDDGQYHNRGQSMLASAP
jgi:hypothetical protein